jgi:hypothetical protein
MQRLCAQERDFARLEVSFSVARNRALNRLQISPKSRYTARIAICVHGVRTGRRHRIHTSRNTTARRADSRRRRRHVRQRRVRRCRTAVTAGAAGDTAACCTLRVDYVFRQDWRVQVRCIVGAVAHVTCVQCALSCAACHVCSCVTSRQ